MKCCRSCCGLVFNQRKAILLESVYACDQCLHHFDASHPGRRRLIPSPSFVLCSQCCCDLTSKLYCEIAGRCKTWLLRPFCSECNALTAEDITKHKANVDGKALEKARTAVAWFPCIYCAGREAFAIGRRSILYTLIKRVFEQCPPNPLDLAGREMTIYSFKTNSGKASEIGELVFGLRYNGLR